MDQTDFAIAMVSGVLIIIAIFLFVLFKIFGKKKNAKLNGTALPDIDKIEPREFQPEKFGIRTGGIEGLEKEFQLARELQKRESVIEIMGEQNEEKSSIEPEKKIRLMNETAQIQKEKNEETLKGSTEPIKEITLSQPVILSNEDNEKLKLEDILIEIRDEKTTKKARTKRSSSKNLEKADKLKEREIPEKKPRKKPGKKVSKKEKTQSIVNENPESGEL